MMKGVHRCAQCWLVVAATSCGPEVGPPVDGTGSAGSSSVTTDAATDPGQSSGELPLETTSSSTSAGTEGSDSTGSTGEATECPPRELPELSGWFHASIDGRAVYPAPEQADCQLDELELAAATTTLQLSCSFPDGSNGAMALRFDLELDLEGVPLSIGMPLRWSRASEVCCGDWDQHAMGLRDADGALVVGVFMGWDATGEAAAVLAPLELEIAEGLCPACEPLGCVRRTAVDVAVDGSAAVRIYDGATAVVGDDPAFRTYVVTAQNDVVGIGGGPGNLADTVSLRVGVP
jgi:hypothetical protein